MRALPFLGIVLAAACGDKQPTSPPAAPGPPAAPAVPARPAPIDLDGLVDGPACFVVRTPAGTVRQSDEALCAKRLRPASTFKIPNALIGAEVGLLGGPDAIMTYDAKAYPKEAFWFEDWARDQPLREAMRISAVPLFRRLAVQIGPERMQRHLDAFAYGNRDLSGGQDRFWLSGGGLAISAREQVDFLAKLVAGTLPVSAKAMATAREALPTEQADDATLHWKTGTAREEPSAGADRPPWTAWLVGWVERPDGNHVFACWIEEVGEFEQVTSRRMAFCKGVLARLGLFAPALGSGAK